ncbi:MAG TPA: C-GCAxxG-C-C family (seleno)protein [Desulfovibrio sp.]|jgi:C_GCAxxG_C_C family probable redox protein|uniref:C-GCAxxG-C-C family (seleno)protein n=1 Tax=Desulfovibrio TaxID=872 RepID=UPI002A430BE1|nr:C-GCAxxG-C-C family (seleno)protein [Desulfovibrio sp.]MDY0306390.1 C-GCAxxG-C-C family (seleno)protein [Desulfovibrionaceae bacterium]HMM39606.1 C-GCAxxG-C-C family (seleno)protein [Desulfovibrio sp.]
MTLESPQARIGAAATEIFLSRPQNCAEAVVLALNRHLTGGLAPAQAAGVASGFSLGLGGAGCLCGALSGATLCIGLFLAPKGDRLERRAARKAAKALHHSFLELHGSVCCRELCRALGDETEARAKRCSALTGYAAAEAARLILETRPELAGTGFAPAPGLFSRLRRLLRP